MTTTPPKIDLRLGAAALRAPAASRKDSRPQAILKYQPRNSFNYRVCYKPQIYHLQVLKPNKSELSALTFGRCLFLLR